MSRVFLIAGLLLSIAGCKDLDRFSSNGGSFEGVVVRGSFVRSGVTEDARLCLTLDTNNLQDAPGAITSSDGRFRATPLRPIPQIWHDPLSTLSFGDGRERNFVYVATEGGPVPRDVMVIVSLMHAGNIEVRLLRGAPQPSSMLDGGAREEPLFGVFSLNRREGACL